MSIERHRLGVEVEPESKAVLRFWEFPKVSIESFVELEEYEIKFKFRNLGERRFPGGSAWMRILWRFNQGVLWPLTIPELEPRQTEYATFPNALTTASSEVLSNGFGLIFCDCIESQDRQAVDLTDYEGKILFGVGHYATSVKSIKATTWASLYAKPAAMASVASLLILALDKVIPPFMRWLLPLLGLDP